MEIWFCVRTISGFPTKNSSKCELRIQILSKSFCSRINSGKHRCTVNTVRLSLHTAIYSYRKFRFCVKRSAGNTTNFIFPFLFTLTFRTRKVSVCELGITQLDFKNINEYSNNLAIKLYAASLMKWKIPVENCVFKTLLLLAFISLEHVKEVSISEIISRKESEILKFDKIHKEASLAVHYKINTDYDISKKCHIRRL